MRACRFFRFPNHCEKVALWTISTIPIFVTYRIQCVKQEEFFYGLRDVLPELDGNGGRSQPRLNSFRFNEACL